MNQNLRTTGFAAIGGLLALAAGWTWNASKPPVSTLTEDQGKPFFAELEKGEIEPESMEVYALDKNGRLQEFIVRKKDGLWTIPSHNNYPAEAADRLARTTASLAGLSRQAIDSRSPADHEKRGVLDPLDPSNSDPETTGKRIVVKGPGDVKLADLIVGKPAGSPASAGPDRGVPGTRRQELFFVRAGGENSVYRIPLKLDISTAFSDWIDPTLLKMGESLPVALRFDNYQIEEEKDPLGRMLGLVKKQGEQFLLNRPDPATPWELVAGNAKLDPTSEQLNQTALNGISQAVESLRIRGVRPKFTYLGEQLITPDLKLNTSASLVSDRNRFGQALAMLQTELSSRGFNLIPKDRASQELALVAENGELELGTNDGLRYFLYFGRVVEGDEKTVEIGELGSEIGEPEPAQPANSDPAAAAPAEPAQPDAAAADSAAAATESAPAAAADATVADAAEKEENRYVMIRVAHDESLLGPRPVEPVAPTAPPKPDGYVPAPAAPEVKAGEAAPEPPADTRDPRFIEYDVQQAEFEQAQMHHEMEEIRHKTALEQWEQKRAAAAKRVAELNDRFGAWYYVVSGKNLKELRLGRAELVSPLDPQSFPPPPVVLPPVPDISFGDPAETEKGGAGGAVPPASGTDPPSSGPPGTSGSPPESGDGAPEKGGSPTEATGNSSSSSGGV